MSLPRSPRVSLTALVAAVWLAGCATPGARPGAGPTATAPAARTPAAAPAPGAGPTAGMPPAAPGSAAAGAPGAAAPVATAATPTPPGALRPFADVIKDTKKLEGVFTLYQKDDKVWIELAPQDFNQPLILSPKFKTGIGEGRLVGGLMDEEVLIEFRRIHNTVQMLASNWEYFARAGSPEQRSVDVSFSPSLLGSVPVLSQPHPERKSVLVELNPLLVSDVLGLGLRLQRSYRQGYAFDARNSAITTVRNTPELLVLEVLSHFYTASIAVPQPPVPGQPPNPGPQPTTPRALPDARSLFFTMHYSLARLPAQPMRARVSDPRIGYFATSRMDYADDLARSPRVRAISRWRLEKKDPAAELSEPVKPITFWIDRTVPEKYRASVIAGVLEWNKAFEKIGFKDAIRAEVAPENADWDTLDLGRASIRWMTSAVPAFGGIGPSHVDPRSGEILDADIGLESLSSRNLRAFRSSTVGAGLLDIAGAVPTTAPAVPAELAARGMRGMVACQYADAAAEQFAYAMDVMEARGDLEPGSPESERFVQAYIKDVTMHEVGHTLGLRHNFRASRVWTAQQLRDPDFVARNGLTGSVMEYAAINLPLPEDSARLGPRAWDAAFNPTIGPYDYWAIEYGYRPFAPEAERQGLQRIAARNAEPQLAYGTDEDQFLGIDPEALQFDLGSDPVAFARERVVIARDLLQRQEQRVLRPDQDWSVLRRSVGFALRDLARAGSILTRQIGGVRTVRDFPGSGRDPLQPVPAAQQRAALDILARDFLAADAFTLSPALQRRLAVDFEERTDAVFRGDGPVATDFSLASLVFDLQRSVLGALTSETVAARLLDSEAKAPAGTLRYAELLDAIERAVWSEVLAPRGTTIAQPRRELQRDHLNRVSALLLRPNAAPRADVRGLVRAHAQALLQRIEAASRRGGLDEATRAHLKDSADTLSVALGAKLPRVGA